VASRSRALLGAVAEEVATKTGALPGVEVASRTGDLPGAVVEEVATRTEALPGVEVASRTGDLPGAVVEEVATKTEALPGVEVASRTGDPPGGASAAAPPGEEDSAVTGLLPEIRPLQFPVCETSRLKQLNLEVIRSNGFIAM